MNAQLRRVLGSAAILCLAVLVFAPSTHALGFKNGRDVVISSGEVYDDDLVVTGNSVTVNGTIKGDLIAFGRDIIVNGVVEGDLMGAAQSVIVNGVVSDDVRVAGAVITVGPRARVADDLMVAGGSAETQPGSTIGGDVLVGASRSLLAGAINGKAYVGGERASIQGPVKGNVYADINSSAETDGVQPWMFQTWMPNMPPWVNVPAGLVVGPNAKIGGKLEYTSPKEANIATGTVREGNVKYRPRVVTNASANEAAATQPLSIGQWLLYQLRDYVSLALVGALLFWLVPRFFPRIADTLNNKPWPSLGWGFVGAIVIPGGAILLLVVAIMLAVLFGAVQLSGLGGSVVIATLATLFGALVIFGLIVTYACKLIAAFWLGRAVFGRSWHAHPIWLMLIGLLAIVLLSAAPYIGGLLTLTIVLFTLGALWLAWRDWRQQRASIPSIPTPGQTSSTVNAPAPRAA